MLKTIIRFASFALLTTYAQAEQLTIERIYSSPSLNGQTPRMLKISPHGKQVTYLKAKAENKNQYDLWRYNIADKSHSLLVDSNTLLQGPEQLSDEEKARRERQRVYGFGIMEYQFSADGKQLLFPLNGDLYLYNLTTKQATQLTRSKAYETDAKFSPKGHYVSFIRNQNIYAINLKNHKEIKLTKDGKGLIKNGMAEFVAQEEMKRMTGYWWSPDETKIAYLRVDESPVDTIIRNEIYADSIKLIEQKYPAAGRNNVAIQLKLVNVKTKRKQDIDLGNNKDIYIPRVKWFPDSRKLSYQWQSRDQHTLKLRVVDSETLKQYTLLTEQSDHWVNLNNDLRFLHDGKSLIWASERNGFKHLYLFNYQGKLLAQLTNGNWVVDQLEAVDEQNQWIYFTGRADTPLERHLYRVPFSGKNPEHVNKISHRSGTHAINFAANASVYLDYFSNTTTPPNVSLHKANGEQLTWLAENKVDENHPIKPYFDDLVIPEFGSLQSADGQATLYYKIYKPKNFVSGKKYPVIINVYGGPHAQRVTNRWEGGNLTQIMLQQGYIVFQLDNRGSNYRGTAFEFPIYRHLGDVEVQDQITGVKFLRTLPYVDENRIGIYGHSYGGYMALMTSFKAPEYFKAAVSGAPVTDWKLYDTHYTERYLGHPQENAEGYQLSSVFPYIDGLKNPLLIYHGMADDNVLFKNTTKLIKALQDKNKKFELMTYPGSKHSMRGKSVKVHLNNTILDFFNRHFKN